MFHIYYRASNFDKPESRPESFSKIKCLKNFLFALKKISEFKLTIFFDGKPSKDFRGLVKDIGRISKLARRSNSESFWHAYLTAIKQKPNDLVYFVEDDYIHTPDALMKLLECSNELKVDYITLYDHPVRYANDYHFGLDVPHRINRIYLTKSHHWRTQESTCMTFASRVKTLRADYKIFDKYVRQRNVPEDRELFKRLQGLAGYEEGSPFRVLVGPIPSLCTHCHKDWLAPTINWQKILEKTII